MEKDKNVYLEPDGSKDCQIHENMPLYWLDKRQGEYTLEDYYELPDDQRVELIDGVIYDVSATTSVHQLLCGIFFARLYEYIRSKHGKCIPVMSPVDVQLDCDDKTMVQPDVLVLCDDQKLLRRCVYGAPDFVAEILSPSTKRKDMFIKAGKYQNAGVKEYWMVDPDKKQVLVYDFTTDCSVELHGFDEKIAVHIFDGDCEIDMPEIYEEIKFMYEKEDI